MITRRNQSLKAAALDILRAEQPVTLRQLFYRLVSVGVLANSQQEYKRLGRLMTLLRERGRIPLSWIVDHIRSTLKPPSWSGLADFGEAVRESYRKDFWASLNDHVEVLVEKDAVAGTIQPVTNEYDVALRVCRGYCSVSFIGEIAELWAQTSKPIHAYYLGDFDPSGFDLERDLKAKLTHYSDKPCLGPDDDAGVSGFRWHRLAIQEDDFEQFGLVCLPVKPKDPRARKFQEAHGHDCAEVDALPPSELRRRVKEAILAHVDREQWERLQSVESLERENIQRLVGAWERPNGQKRT